MATGDDATEPPRRKPPVPGDARLARKAEALRANLKRRKSQSRGRADQRDDGPTATD